jgi:formamidopyrimidine-DNA glycosylase
MPELPEVETIRLGLSELLPKQKVLAATYDWPKSFPNEPKTVERFLVGSTIESIDRRAKVLIIHLSTGYSLLIHLKMTGQLVYVESEDKRFGAGHPNDSLIASLPNSTTRVIFELERWSDAKSSGANGRAKLFFNDLRKFGWVKLIPTVEIDQLEFMKKLGPEPLGDFVTEQMFIDRIRRRANSYVKIALINQEVIAGVGNIYADESLWASGIKPTKRVKNVSEKRLKLLLGNVKEVLKLGIEKGGSTDKNYVNSKGQKGSYLEFAKVFRREGLACSACGDIIIKIRVNGRGTHYCPTCQKR